MLSDAQKALKAVTGAVFNDRELLDVTATLAGF
jgi:hypothetical protein